MKRKTVLIVCYIFAAFSIFLPWFTYNYQVMGWRWGTVFLKWLVVPMIVIGMYAFSSGKNKVLAGLAELCSVLNIGILVLAFGGWQELSNIKPGFDWGDGFHTATAGFWIAAAAFVILFAALQLQAFRKDSLPDSCI